MTRKYNIIYADPPWSFNSVKSGGSMKSGAAAKYQTMTLDQMKALDVPALCEKDCVLIMWYVSSQPQEALDLVKAWGFTLKNMNAFIWRKLSTNLIPHFGMGYWTRAGAECALIAVRGKPKAECRSIRQVRDEVVGEHSEKPGIFRDDIVKLCGDLPRLEMFARTAPAGWDVFGNEVDGSVHIDGNEPSATTCDAPAEPVAAGRALIDQACVSETEKSESQPVLTAETEPQTETPQGEAHPFFSGFYNGNATYVQTVKDKIERVKTLSHEQCKVALTLSNLGSSVTDALNRRIKQLEREGMAA